MYCKVLVEWFTFVIGELVEMLDEYSYLGFPLDPAEVKKTAFDFAKENDIEGFSLDLGTAGRAWFAYLLKRHPKLSVKSATNISLQRAEASSENLVMEWFTKYLDVLGQMGISSPEQVWNVDEHGTEHSVKTKKVVGKKGVRQYQVQPTEKPNRTTMVTYVNAAGYALPPLIIHKGKYHPTWSNFKMPGAMVRGTKKGYINKEVFLDYGKKWIYHLYASGMIGNGKRNLLLMDSHYSHVFNYAYMKMMYERNIKVLAVNPHSTHWSQPLDKNPFSSFKEKFNKQVKEVNRKKKGKPINKEEYMMAFNVAWAGAMTPANIKAGFKRTGIWPPNPSVIPQELFQLCRKSESKSVCN